MSSNESSGFSRIGAGGRSGISSNGSSGISTIGAGGIIGMSSNESSGFSRIGAGGRSGISSNGSSGISTTGAGGINGISLIFTSGISTVGASVGSSHVGSVLFSPIASPRPPTRATLKVDEAVVSSDVRVILFVGLRLSLTGFISFVL